MTNLMKPQSMKQKRNLEFHDNKKVVDRIKAKIDLLELMESVGIEITNKNERSAKAKCFAHDENTPSLVINRDKQLFNCFGAGCSIGGDLLTFWMQFKSLDFITACNDLINTYKIDVQDLIKAPSSEDIERDRLLYINNTMADAFYTMACTSKVAKDWLKTRGLGNSESTLLNFRIGYVPDYNFVRRIAKPLKLQDKDFSLLQFDSKEIFNNRIIYPIQDMNGNVLSFYGRTLNNDKIKYIGMHAEHKTLGFKHPLMKTDMPYGLCHTELDSLNNRNLLLVEGFNDVLVAYANGIKNVAGMRGSLPSPKMYELLKSYNMNNIIICPDGDEAGYRSIESINKNRVKHQVVKIMTLPHNFDPDDFINVHGADIFKERINDAVYPVEIIIRKGAEKLSISDSVSMRLDIAKELSTQINLLSGFELEFALQELATITGVDRHDLDNLIASSGGAEFSDNELESKLIAECIEDRGKAIHAISILKPDDFASVRHASWWKLLRSMIADDIEVFSYEMFITYAIDKDVIKQSETNIVPKHNLGSINIDYSAKKLVEMSMRRRLNKSGADFIHSLQNPKKTVEESLNDHVRMISNSMVNEKVVTTAGEHVIHAMDTIYERMRNPGIPGINIGTNWRKLMSQIMGFQPGHMLSIAAISKAGKTAIAQNWCIEQLKNSGQPTLWVNLEMSDLDLTLRNLSIMTGIPNQRLKIGNISKEERAKLEEASTLYHGFPLYVASMAGSTVFDVVNTIRKYVYSNGIKIVFIDYIQLIQASGRHDKIALWEAQNDIVSSIRQAISTLKITGVVISQLNRGAMAEGSASGQHVSGTIKLIQDSDVFMGLKSKSKQEMLDTPHSNSSLMVEFNRHGPQETCIDLDFNRECIQIEEV